MAIMREMYDIVTAAKIKTAVDKEEPQSTSYWLDRKLQFLKATPAAELPTNIEEAITALEQNGLTDSANLLSSFAAMGIESEALCKEIEPAIQPLTPYNYPVF